MVLNGRAFSHAASVTVVVVVPSEARDLLSAREAGETPAPEYTPSCAFMDNSQAPILLYDSSQYLG